MEVIRELIFLLPLTDAVVFEMFFATRYSFAFGDELKPAFNCALA